VQAFSHADRDGGGDLSIEEFVRAFLGILGKDMGEEGLRQVCVCVCVYQGSLAQVHCDTAIKKSCES
jgi:hypothetical protein